jgi:hypothetical protein
VFTAQLSASNETTPIAGGEQNARGDVRITFNLTRDAANNVSGGSATFVVNLRDFPAGAIWTLAHIHRGASGVAGNVVVNTGLTPPTTNIPLTNGTISNQTFSNQPIVTNGQPDVALINDIISNPAGFYFNVHTAANGNGAVRGQLVKQ